MTRAIVCDFGGVLTTPLADAFAAWSRHSSISLSDLGEAMAALADDRGSNPLHDLECARLGEREFLDLLGARLGHPIGDFADVWWGALHTNEEMLALMRRLAVHHTMALCTNNVREWEPRWRPMIGSPDPFELVIDSSVAGVRKPDPEIYELVLERLGLGARECLFIDDFAENCEAARAAGMVAVHFRSNAQAIAEIEAQL